VNADPWLPESGDGISHRGIRLVATLTFDVSGRFGPPEPNGSGGGIKAPDISQRDRTVLVALIGWLNPRGSSTSSDVESGRSLVRCGAVLIGLVGLSALGAVMPILSIARLGDICLGWLACLAIAVNVASRLVDRGRARVSSGPTAAGHRPTGHPIDFPFRV